MSPGQFLQRYRVTFVALGASAALHAAVIAGWPGRLAGPPEAAPAIYDVSLIVDPNASRMTATTAAAPRPAPRRARPSPPKPTEAIAHMQPLLDEAGPGEADAATGEGPARLLAGSDEPPMPELLALAPVAVPIPALEAPKFFARALPAKISITYSLGSYFADGRAEYTWTRDGDRYEINGSMEAVGVFTMFLEGRIMQQSRGTITPEGLRPERFTESRPGALEEGLAFDWTKRRMTFTRRDESREGPLTDNTVDWLSMIFQLAHMPPASSDKFDLRVFTQRKLYVFTLESLGVETIELPIGRVRALHLRHQGTSGNEAVDVWLGIEQEYLPVKMRYPVARNRFMVEQLATSVSAAP